MRDTRFPALVYDKQHDFKIQNSVNRTPVTEFTKTQILVSPQTTDFWTG
jgi:hypothetical protein